jgi:hypothetical protein
MALYIFQHPKTKEVQEVIQTMSETHIYEKDGVQWVRIFAVPALATGDTPTMNDINPFDNQAFIKKTGKMHVTQGDLWDASAELSEKRAKKHGGIDPIKAKAVSDYAKKTGGKKHPLVP